MEFEEILTGFVFLEAPRVDDAGNLYFSEVIEGGVHRLAPDGRLDSFAADRKWIGGLALTTDGGFISSSRDGLEYCNPATGERHNLELAVEGRPIRGINDIQPDALGGLYFGCNDFAAISEGRAPAPDRLYRLDASGAVAALQDGVLVSNGIGISPDGRWLYHVDTYQGLCVYDRATDGGLSNRRVLVAGRGMDGLQVDAEGGIWVAGYATGDLTRYRPDGSVDRRIDFSGEFEGCAVTSLTFGGADLRDLYVVTAGDYRRPAKGQGRVHRARSDVPGQRTPLVAVRPC